MNLPKVLIGCPVSERKDYCIPQYLDNITNFTYPEKKFYFSDNSFDQWFHVKHFILNGFNCSWVSPKGKSNNQYITESFNDIRNHFLNSDCEYWLSLEIDLFPPHDIIEQLLSYRTGIVSCHYFIGEGKNSRLLHQQFSDHVNINTPPSQSFLEFVEGRWTSGNAGLGCILISKSIMEEISFHVEDEVNHCDTIFSRDLEYVGIEVKYSGILVEHRNKNWSQFSDFKK